MGEHKKKCEPTRWRIQASRKPRNTGTCTIRRVARHLRRRHPHNLGEMAPIFKVGHGGAGDAVSWVVVDLAIVEKRGDDF